MSAYAKEERITSSLAQDPCLLSAWKQYVPLKNWYSHPYTTPHGVTHQNTVTSRISVTITSNIFNTPSLTSPTVDAHRAAENAKSRLQSTTRKSQLRALSVEPYGTYTSLQLVRCVNPGEKGAF